MKKEKDLDASRTRAKRAPSKDSVCAFFAHTVNDGKIYNVKCYNLMCLSKLVQLNIL